MDETGDARDGAADREQPQGVQSSAGEMNTAAVVFEMVRQVAKGRPIDVALDTPLTEMGLTSLERMEVLGLVEEHYGGRFPEMVLMDLETCGEVVEAVETHLIGGGS